MTFHSPIEPSAQPPEASADARHANLPALIEALPGDDTRAPQTEFTRARQAAFLAALAESGSARAAAKACAVSRMTVYRARRANPAFRRGWDAALLAARVHAEEVLATRALDGIEEQVFYHGEVVATRRRYSDRLLLAHLARLDRLTANAEVNLFAEDFEAALGRFEAGSDTPEIDPAAPLQAQREEKDPGQCNRCNRSPAEDEVDEEPEPCPDCGGNCLGPEEALTHRDCRSYDYRAERMYEAHPADAPWPEDFPPYNPDAVEAVQLAAFEAGVPRWWLVVPPGEGADGEWTYAE